MWVMMAASAGVMAQKEGFGYKFYGQVRTDLFYNSRSNSETVDGLFYMYPKDVAPDADGKDLNAKPDGNFYTLYTRLGVDVTGPTLGKAKTSAKVEVDFRGSGTTYSLFRIRHVYFNLDWGKSALLVGQTWHPLYGDVAPEILNLNMGAPYQPFSRAPQVRYRFTNKNFKLTAAAIWQSQYLSVGPSSNETGAVTTTKSQSFMKNGCLPEFYLGMDYNRPGLLAGAGVHVSSMSPRTESKYNDNIYKVSERVTGVSAEAHVKYVHRRFLLAAKSVLGSNLTQTSTIGGYGITSTDSRTGEQGVHSFACIAYLGKYDVWKQVPWRSICRVSQKLGCIEKCDWSIGYRNKYRPVEYTRSRTDLQSPELEVRSRIYLDRRVVWRLYRQGTGDQHPSGKK